jgi:exodeoxyribonuclease VII small subunit
MANDTSTHDQPPTPTRNRSRRAGSSNRSDSAEASGPTTSDAAETEANPEAVNEENLAADLNFREAQMALEISLAELQAPDLDVEEMAGLYERARHYADRCEALLQRVEQEVMQWNPEQPLNSPRPYEP